MLLFIAISAICQATTNTDQDDIVLCASRASNLGPVSVWSSTRHVCFNLSKTSLLSVSCKHLLYSPRSNHDSISLYPTEWRSLLKLFTNPFCWSSLMSTLNSHVLRKVDFLLHAKSLFTPTYLPLYKARIRLKPEYCSCVWGGKSFAARPLLVGFSERPYGWPLVTPYSKTCNRCRAVASFSFL